MAHLLPLIPKVVGMKVPKSLLRPPKNFKVARPKDFESDMQRLGEDIAEGFKKRVIRNIETNRYGYNLSPTTIKRKMSDIPLVDSGELIASIYREETTVSVEDTPREDSSLTNKQLAIVHEYGVKDKHFPARPVWRRTFEDYQKDAKKQVKEFLKTKKFKNK